MATNAKSHKGIKEGEAIILDVAEGESVNTLLIGEDISKGQRVEEFIIEAYINGAWHYIAKGTTIGYKRLIRFSDTTAEKIRVTIAHTRKDANISTIGLYYAELLTESSALLRVSDISTEDWQCVNIDAEAAIDGNRSTTWQSEGLVPLIVDMGKEEEISGFCYAPTTEEELCGTIFKYNFYISLDGEEWVLCQTSGEFSNIKHNPIPYYVHFGRSYHARYFKLEPIQEIDGKEYTSIGEIGVLK